MELSLLKGSQRREGAAACIIMQEPDCHVTSWSRAIKMTFFFSVHLAPL